MAAGEFAQLLPSLPFWCVWANKQATYGATNCSITQNWKCRRSNQAALLQITSQRNVSLFYMTFFWVCMTKCLPHFQKPTCVFWKEHYNTSASSQSSDHFVMLVWFSPFCVYKGTNIPFYTSCVERVCSVPLFLTSVCLDSVAAGGGASGWWGRLHMAAGVAWPVQGSWSVLCPAVRLHSLCHQEPEQLVWSSCKSGLVLRSTVVWSLPEVNTLPVKIHLCFIVQWQ